MKQIRLDSVLLIGLVLVMNACQVENGDLDLHLPTAIQEPIVNGQVCGAQEHESAVELIVDAEVDFGILGVSHNTTYMCGGTLIAPDVVMTAAHCVAPEGLTHGIGVIKNLSYYVTWDDDLRYLNESEGPVIPKNAVKVIAIVPHEKYASGNDDGLGNERDIALIFLEKPTPRKPAVLITKDELAQIKKGASVSIAGWGRTSAKTMNIFGKKIQSSDGVKYCAQTTINEVGTYEMQIGSDEQSSKKCFGDSGGPTYMQVDTPFGSQARVIGVTSHAYDAKQCEKGGVDTRADAWLDWIDQKMREGCETGVRSWCIVDGIVPPPSQEEHLIQLISEFMTSVLNRLRPWSP